MSYFRTLFLAMILFSCTMPPKKTAFSVFSENDCPNYTGTFQCPEMTNIKKPLPAYTIYAKTTRKGEIYIYESHLSISPGKKSKIIADGKKRTTEDYKGVIREYKAHCSKGILINHYLTSDNRTAQTEMWIDREGHLKVRYDFAEGKILTCNRVAAL